VEPIYYVPIIPMILVNGTKGIGTGFSTDIMCYNPLQIIEFLEAKLNNSSISTKVLVEPYYQGFKGKIYPCDDTHKKYIIKGCYEILSNDKIRITELPIGTWTQDYKEFLESILDTKTLGKGKVVKSGEDIIKDFNDMSTDLNVDFEITFYPGIMSKLLLEKHEYNIEGIEKYLKLYSIHCTTNMHLFNEKEQLRKFDSVYEIIDSYYGVRYDYYIKRKAFIITKLENELKVLSAKSRFIQYNLEDKIDLRKKSKQEIYNILSTLKFDLGESGDYYYLVKMPMDSVCMENAEKLMNEYENKNAELETIKACSIEQMWLKELKELKVAYKEFLELINKLGEKSDSSKKSKKK
jgi:DNA topoisomerase-2